MADDEAQKIAEQFVELRLRYPDARDALDLAFFLGCALSAVQIMPAQLLKAIEDSHGPEGALQLLTPGTTRLGV